MAKLKQLIVFTFLSVILNASVNAQDHDSSRQLLLNALFSDYKETKIEKRAFISFDSKEKKRNPINYLAGSLLFMYQNVFSAQISANCVYETSCSEFTKKSIQKYGLIKGSFIGMHQLSCCTPTIHKDYCEHSISENGKIINRID